jgi:hypothetical protein
MAYLGDSLSGRHNLGTNILVGVPGCATPGCACRLGTNSAGLEAILARPQGSFMRDEDDIREVILRQIIND